MTGIEQVRGSAFNDTITGNESANVLVGMGGADSIDGGGGDDVLVPDGTYNAEPDGDDVLDGGDGDFDVVSYFAAVGPMRISLESGFATGDGNDSLTKIENVVGSDFADVITGDSHSNFLYGLAGNDQMDGGPGDDGWTGVSEPTRASTVNRSPDAKRTRDSHGPERRAFTSSYFAGSSDPRRGTS